VVDLKYDVFLDQQKDSQSWKSAVGFKINAGHVANAPLPAHAKACFDDEVSSRKLAGSNKYQ
jgi:hypothetical protein